MLEFVAALAIGYGQPINTEEASCMAEAVWFEARDQPIAGQVYVAQVIMNRVGSTGYPNTVCEVVNQPYQFSYTLESEEWRLNKLRKANKIDELAKKLAAVISLQAISGGFSDLHFAQHYYNPSKASPRWASSFDEHLKVGDHKFLWNN